MKEPNFNSFKLCKHGQKLTVQEKTIFLNRIKELDSADCDKIYRGGETASKLLEAYHLTRYDFPSPFTYKFFLIGQKGKGFLENLRKEISNKEVFTVSDASKKFLSRIFEMLNSLLVQKTLKQNLNGVINNFKHEQKALYTFFSDNNNKNKFVELFRKLSDGEKIQIRDYYLTLLHHISDSQYYPISFMLSVTKDLQVAVKFSERARKSNDEIILFGWIPKSAENPPPIFSYLTINPLLKEKGFPLYTKSFFPKQQEITLKGGLLPHFIIGFLYTKNGTEHFEVNPNIFDVKDEDWIIEGLPINQTEFWEELKRTNMKGGFYVDLSGEYNELRLPK